MGEEGFQGRDGTADYGDVDFETGPEGYVDAAYCLWEKKSVVVILKGWWTVEEGVRFTWLLLCWTSDVVV